MANDPATPELKNIWQNQSVEGTTMSLEEIRKKIGQLKDIPQALLAWWARSSLRADDTGESVIHERESD